MSTSASTPPRIEALAGAVRCGEIEPEDERGRPQHRRRDRSHLVEAAEGVAAAVEILRVPDHGVQADRHQGRGEGTQHDPVGDGEVEADADRQGPPHRPTTS